MATQQTNTRLKIQIKLWLQIIAAVFAILIVFMGVVAGASFMISNVWTYRDNNLSENRIMTKITTEQIRQSERKSGDGGHSRLNKIDDFESARTNDFALDDLKSMRVHQSRSKTVSSREEKLSDPFISDRQRREVMDFPLNLLHQKYSEKPHCHDHGAELEDKAVRTVQRRKSFRYIAGLHQGMTRETERADSVEDYSSATWAIRAYSPILRDGKSVLFRAEVDGTCNITRVEYLVGTKCDGRRKSKADISIQVNKQTIHRSEGTIVTKGTAVFDLSGVLKLSMVSSPAGDTHRDEEGNLPSNSNHGISVSHFVNITIDLAGCKAAHSCHSMLFVYCNINDTTRRRFKGDSDVKSLAQPVTGEPVHSTSEDAKDESKNEKTDVDKLYEELGMVKVPMSTRVKELRKEMMRKVPRPIQHLRRSPKGAAASLARPDLSKTLKGLVHISKPPDSQTAGSLSEKHSASETSDTQRVSRARRSTREQHLSRRVPRYAVAATKPKEKRCHRDELRVHLHDDTNFPVVFPNQAVDIGRCVGDCTHGCYMGQPGVTAHAVLLNRVANTTRARERWGHGLRWAQCVPFKMKTMSVSLSRYSESKELRIDIVNWPNMIVASCRCA